MLHSSSIVGQENTVKDAFCDLLHSTVSKVSAAETLVICGDFIVHVGKLANGFESIHDDHGYRLRNTKRERILEFAAVNDLVVGSSHFNKKDNLITD